MHHRVSEYSHIERPVQAVNDSTDGRLSCCQESPVCDNPAYLSSQLITYIGNKRALLRHIGAAIDKVKARLGRKRLRILDAFAGSGVVSRYFKSHAEFLVSNDIEDYAVVVAKCYLRNKSAVDIQELNAIVDELNAEVESRAFPKGFIEDLYAPKNENRIVAGDRVFYTRDNARRLDAYRRLISLAPPEYFDLLLGPLLSQASIHANTAGVFKGFYKDRVTKIGRFGGTNSDALSRIKGRICIQPPVLSRFECDVQVLQKDANDAVRLLSDLDIAYFDPPYNQHPYGSNYFMLNLLVDYQKPLSISKVSGIPVDWKRSDYNVRARFLLRLQDLFENTDARFFLVSFNNEGFATPDEMIEAIGRFGSVERIEMPYNTFRGSRNLCNRSIHVMEHLYLLERN